MSKKSGKIAALIQSLHGKEFDAHYLGFFDCFNRGLYYEAHDVLEELWLPQRGKPDDLFYKGLIQLAGAFVHLQKDRLRPAGALFGLAAANLIRYPAIHHGLELTEVLKEISRWQDCLETSAFSENPLKSVPAPCLTLRSRV